MRNLLEVISIHKVMWSGRLIRPRQLPLRGSFQYSAELTQIVDPTDIEVLQPSNEPTLTLVTCYLSFA